MLGGTLIQLTGNNIKFDESATYTCLFDDIEVEGMYFTQSGVDQILCVSPVLKQTGRIDFAIGYSSSPISTQRNILINDTFFSCKCAHKFYNYVRMYVHIILYCCNAW